MRHLERFAMFLGEGRRPRSERALERSHEQRQRRAELVAHVREEERFRAVELRETLCAPALRLERAGVANGGDDLLRGELEERAVAVVERAVRAHTADEDAVRLRLVRRGQGK